MCSGSAQKRSSAGSWPPAARSSGFPATSREPGKRTPARPASRPPTTGPWSGVALRSPSSPGLHLEDREQGAKGKRRDDDGEDHGDHADCGRLPDAVTLEGNLVEQERNVGRVLTWTAVREHVDRVVGLDDEERSEERAELDEWPGQG